MEIRDIRGFGGITKKNVWIIKLSVLVAAYSVIDKIVLQTHKICN